MVPHSGRFWYLLFVYVLQSKAFLLLTGCPKIMVDRRFCIWCGKFFDPDYDGYYTYCSPCRRMINVKRYKFKYIPHNNGKITESRRKRGRKAYYTRLANLYFSDRERFDRLFGILKGKYPYRAGQVTRKINLIERDHVYSQG